MPFPNGAAGLGPDEDRPVYLRPAVLILGVLVLVGVGVTAAFFIASAHYRAKLTPQASQPANHTSAPSDPVLTAPEPVVHALPKEDRSRSEPPPPLPRDGSTDDDGDVGSAPGQEAGLTSLPPEEQRKVDEAIRKGVQHLRDLLATNKNWPLGAGGEEGAYPVGYASFLGLTLLECHVQPGDPAVQQAPALGPQKVRDLQRHSTYQMSLAILFLDRLQDPRDRDLIRKLALRLVAGQKSTGGWTYECPLLNADEQDKLLTALQVLTPRNPSDTALQAMEARASGSLPTTSLEKSEAKPLLPGGVQGPGAGQGTLPGEARNLGPQGKLDPDILKKLPESVKRLPVLQEQENLRRRLEGGTDNSNTQFAILALWAARRYDIPMDRTLLLMVRRFRTSQNHDGSWGYLYRLGGGDVGSPAMICVGLLGLAVGHGVAFDARAAAGIESKQPAQDAMIKNGIQALSEHIYEPAGRMENLAMQSLYFLWSVERVAVLYRLKSINDKDWYRWGAEILVANQEGNGSWRTAGLYPGETPTMNTCLALLFLKRANLAKDLTQKLQIKLD